MTIRVFLVSNYQLAAWGLARLFESSSCCIQLQVSACDFDLSTIEAVKAASPDVVLLDIDTDPGQVLPIISALRADVPQSKILLLTRLDDSKMQDRAVMQGAHGVVDKNTSPDILLTAISKVHEGQLWLDHEATARIFVEFSRTSSNAGSNANSKVGSLTEREQQIVTFFAQNGDAPGKVLARMLNISESTLRNHLTSIYAKLGVRNNHGLLAYALQHDFDK